MEVYSGRIVSTVLHKIDIDSSTLQLIPISNQYSDLEDYLSDLLQEIQTKEQKRAYNFLRETTEFFTTLKSYSENQNLQTNTVSSNLAQRLLEKEVITDNKYGHLGTSGRGHVKKGSFLQFLYKNENNISYLGVKIEHQVFLDEEDFRKKIGISIANKIYKACKVDFDEQKNPTTVFIYDTNSRPSTYWWNDFLELKELRTDSYNTKTASQEILKVINRIKKEHPADYTLLRNSTISSFKQNGELKYDEFIDKVFAKYAPVDANLNGKLPNILNNLKELPNKKGFDTQFNLVPSEVPFRKINYSLSKEISLTIEDGIDNISEKIWSEKTASGKELVVIFSPEGFKHFIEKNREQ